MLYGQLIAHYLSWEVGESPEDMESDTNIQALQEYLIAK
jgi:hypothetical protein